MKMAKAMIAMVMVLPCVAVSQEKTPVQFDVITVKPKVEPSELKRKIQEAFKRNAELDANRIEVEANGSDVTLKGTVRSWMEREEAERVAWSAPGITHVEDRIVEIALGGG